MRNWTLLSLVLLLFSLVWADDEFLGGRKIFHIGRRGKDEDVKPKPEPLCDVTVHDLVGREVASALTSSAVFSIHRSGEPQACGTAPISVRLINESLQSYKLRACPKAGEDLDDFMTESLLTTFFHQQLPSDACASTDEIKNEDLQGFLQYCDMGTDMTVPQLDSDSLQRVASGSLPCRFFTREGVRISSLKHLATLVKNSTKVPTEECMAEEAGAEPVCKSSVGQLEIYAVPAGRMFMLTPKYIGEIFELSHAKDSHGEPLLLEVISVSPKVFTVYNFFSPQEADDLVEKALSERAASFRLRNANVHTNVRNRTCDTGWDTVGKLAKSLRKRMVNAFGLSSDLFDSHTEGIEIMRYQKTTGYTLHMDYLQGYPHDPYDYKSARRGGNRYASVLLYMNDGFQGGETVFAGGPVDYENATYDKAINEMRAANEINALKRGSWEERLTGLCRSSMRVQPLKSRALFFYNQLPNGTMDVSSIHGACPTLGGGPKWSANIWMWSAPRRGYEHAPYRRGESQPNNIVDPEPEDKESYTRFSVWFYNTGVNPKFDGAQLYWHNRYFAELGAGESTTVHTFVGHIWYLKDRQGNKLHTWRIGEDVKDGQFFEV